MEEPTFQHILIARTDRIGDVLLTLPSVEAVKLKFPRSRIFMLVSPYTAPLLAGISEILLYNREKSFFKMLKEIRSAQFDAVLVMYPRLRIALLFWFARIPLRIGTGYRWYSFLFNRKVYEHRKTGEKHESEYNLSLAKELGCDITKNISIHLTINDLEKQTAQETRQKLGLTKEPLVLLHPGSGGSARNWKPDFFSQSATELAKLNYQVVITGSVLEESLIQQVAHQAGNGVRFFVSKLNLKEFAAFIQTASLFVANSTGPLHIAAAVGTPVIGFYPPVHAMSPKRWGPLTEKKIIFVPDPQYCQRCHGGKCMGNECMDQILVSQVVDAAQKIISQGNIS